MKLHVFGRHPIPQGGFNGVMSLFECIEFARLGYEVTLLLPFVTKESYEEFLQKHKIGSLDELDRYGARFDIRPVFPDGEGFSECDILIYQSYFVEDWIKFGALCRQYAKVTTKNFPKFVPSPDLVQTSAVLGQFGQFDFVACSLQEDVDLLQADPRVRAEYPARFAYVPRGASPSMLHPGYKSGLPPTIGLDVPNMPDMLAIQHYVRPIERLKAEFPDLKVMSIGRPVPIEGAIKVPFGRFDRIYEQFFNRVHVYCTINYEHSPPHLQAEVQKKNPLWKAKAIYEVQNIEAQMSGAALIGHRSNIIEELYRPGETGFNILDFGDEEQIYQVLRRALLDRAVNAVACRNYAIANYDWRHCVRLWSEGLQGLIRHRSGGTGPAAGQPAPQPAPAAPAAAAPASPAPVAAPTAPIPATPEQEISTLIKLGQKYKWATGEERRKLEAHGVSLGRTDFYSETPSLAEIEASFEYEGYQSTRDSKPIFDDADVFDLARIESYGRSLVEYTGQFAPPVEKTDEGFYWKNSQFSGTDAMSLYGTIRKLRPAKVVEIGCGFSSHVVNAALEANGSGSLTCIDPEPRTDIKNLPNIQFRQEKIQGVPASWFQENLSAGDVVFFDGSHTVKTGSDTIYFYLRILPYLPKGVIVHAHDVRLPFPRNRQALIEAKLYWGEQYLLLAHLYNQARYRVLFASDLVERRLNELSRQLMHGRHGSGGVSLWYEIVG